MTLEEIINRKAEYRVLDSTCVQIDEAAAMIGGCFERKHKNDDNGNVALWNSDKSNYWIFNESDVRELTPVPFDGNRVAIRDRVECDGKWYVVYGYHWLDGNWFLDCLREWLSLEGGCYSLTTGQIASHDMGLKEKVEEMTMEEVCKAIGKTVKIVKK